MKEIRIGFLKVLLPILIVIISSICLKNTDVSEVENIRNQPISMILLYSFNLFTLGGVNLGFPNVSNWAGIVLLMMYFIAPLISISALIEALFSYFEIKNKLKIMSGNHYVIFGAGKISSELPELISEIESNKFKTTTIVAIDKNENAILEKNPKCIFIRSNASNELIDRINLKGSKCIFLNMNDDWSNFLILKEIIGRNIISSAQLKKVFVRIENNSLLHNLIQLNQHKKVVYYNPQIISVESFFNASQNQTKLIQKLEIDSYNLFFVGFGRYSQKFIEQLFLKDLKINKIHILSSNFRNEFEGYEMESNGMYNKLFDIESSILLSNETFGSQVISDYYKNHNAKTIWLFMTEQESLNINYSGILLTHFRLKKFYDEIYVRTNFIDFSEMNLLDESMNFISSYQYTNIFFKKELKRLN